MCDAALRRCCCSWPVVVVMQVNTPFIEMVNQGINHSEGGWPKDVSATDPEQTTRYRRKLEKDEQYAVQMMSLAEVCTRRPRCSTVLARWRHCLLEGRGKRSRSSEIGVIISIDH